MYDGSDIDKAEMNEWLDDTIESMLNGGQPGHVLEIGTGSGMILFNLIRGLQSYVGLEPSGRAVRFINEATQSIPGMANKVKMFKAKASDLGRLGVAFHPDLVVLNSVVQYFPSQDHLFGVVRDLVQLEGVKTLFFGDIRSLPLFREFLVARAMHVAGPKASKDEFRRVMADLARAESELLVDPAFFTSLPSRLPEQVEHVKILPKKMHATNELSAFRYAAVVHIKAGGQPRQLIREMDDDEWIDYAERGLDRRLLLELLQRTCPSSRIAINNIPHGNSSLERHILRSLDDEGEEAASDDNWILAARTAAQRQSSLSVMELVELAAQAGFCVETSWARQSSQNGGLDAIFHRHQPSEGAKKSLFRFPVDQRGPPYQSFCSAPLRQQMRQKTQQLHELLRARLPSYMVPQEIRVLDAMPLNGNGKIDRQALAKTSQTQIIGRQAPGRPTQEAPMSETAPDSQDLGTGFQHSTRENRAKG